MPLPGLPTSNSTQVAFGSFSGETRIGSIESISTVTTSPRSLMICSTRGNSSRSSARSRRLRTVVVFGGSTIAAACPRERQQLERNAVDVDELGLAEIAVVRAPQAAADYLLAEQLRLERPQAEDLRDVPGVPALGEHSDRDQAAHLLARLSRACRRSRRARVAGRPRPAPTRPPRASRPRRGAWSRSAR